MEITKIDYPIAKDDTTVQSIFNNLKVISNNELKFAVEKGKVFINGEPCETVKAKVRDGQVLTYSDFEIKVGINDADKQKRLMTELIRNGGFRGNSLSGGNGSSFNNQI